MTTSGKRSRRSTTTRGAAKGTIKRIKRKKAFFILCQCVDMLNKIEEKVHRLRVYTDFTEAHKFDAVLENVDDVYACINEIFDDLNMEERS